MSSDSLSRLVLPLLALAFVLALCRNADAQNPVNISSVTVLPPGDILPTDPVFLDVLLTSGTASIHLYEPTQLTISGFSIFVDIYADSGLLAIPDSRVETVSLGMLEPGQYEYLVTQCGPTFPPWTPSFETGTLWVLPEPAALSLLAVGASVLVRRQRR